MSKLHQKTGSTCMICDELTKKSILFHKTRRQTHVLCLDCGIGYLTPLLEKATNNVRKNIREGADIINCPGAFHGTVRNLCDHPVQLRNLIVPECEISLDLFRLTYSLQSNNIFICPEMNCGQIVEVDSGYFEHNLVCRDCEITWCRNCLVSPYHVGKSCIEVEADNKNTENGKLIWDMKHNGKLKFCPRCKAPSIKYNGCNKMICGACHSKWCWLCLVQNIDYDHYNSERVGTCTGKLWKGVDSNGNENENENENDLPGDNAM